MSLSLTLGPVLDLRAAAPLRAALLERRGEAMEIDASAVERLGGLCLQVLMAAQHSWAEDGLPFAISGPSDAFREAARLFGASGRLGETLEAGGAF
jgi:chemotaxis protein CheX